MGLPQSVIKVRVVGIRRPRDGIHGKVLQHRQPVEPCGRDLWPQVVRFEEASAVAVEGEVDEPLPCRVLGHEPREVVGLAAVHRPFVLGPFGVLPGVLRHVQLPGLGLGLWGRDSEVQGLRAGAEGGPERPAGSGSLWNAERAKGRGARKVLSDGFSRERNVVVRWEAVLGFAVTSQGPWSGSQGPC